MTLEYSHNRFIKVLALLLVVCLLVSCGLSFNAEAAGSGVAAALYAVGGAAVVGSILHAMGIFHGDAYTDWDSLVTAVLGHLGSLGFVTADGKIKLSVLGAGVTMIPGVIISAVRDFLFSGDSNFAAPLTIVSTAGPGLTECVTSHPNCYYFSYISDTGASGTYQEFSYFSSSALTLTITEYSSYYSFSLKSSSTITQYRYYIFRFIDGTVNRSTTDCGTSVDTSCDKVYLKSYTAEPITGLSSGFVSNGDYDTNAASDDGLNSQDNIDVIYPGWATNSTNVDTNIDVVADAGTGAIDGVITADKYFPIGITDLGVSIYDQTQADAQAGTDVSVIESEADAVKDSTKEDADSFAIGPMSDYTMQLKDFFPFCIPFDIYDLLNCLAADPEAPSFDWKIPVLGQDNIVHVDLAQFNTVASILRTMELLVFCVGLAFVTKHLIQGGAG